MISFVVPAYNEEGLLGKTLIAINEAGRSSGKDYEILVADDASTDRTPEIAREHGARVVSVNHRQIAATRNSGAREAWGDLLIFVDADTTVSVEVVRAAVRAIEQGAIGGGCSIKFSGRLPLYGRFLASVLVPVYRWAKLAAGCFLFCTKAAFDAVGGFDESLFGAEETVMSRALRRHGKFVVLRETVVTSGRKLRSHTGRELLNLLILVMIRGPRALRRRKGLEIWYGERRQDPGDLDP